MSRGNIVTGLDIGTSALKLLTAVKKSEESELEVLSLVQEPAAGIRKGVVIDPGEVSNILQNILERVKAETNQRIDSVYLNVGGSHVFSTPSRGLVSVSRADQKISEEDIDRVLQAARAFSLPLNKEIF